MNIYILHTHQMPPIWCYCQFYDADKPAAAVGYNIRLPLDVYSVISDKYIAIRPEIKRYLPILKEQY